MLGPKIVLPNRLADEIRNHPDLNFGQAISKSDYGQEFFGSYPGLKPFAADRNSKVVADTVRGRLTQSLTDETSKAVNELFDNPETWSEITYKPELPQLIARVSSRVFIGLDLCANENWLRISEEYSIELIIAARALRQWHLFLRPILRWFLPECRKLRATFDEARSILNPLALSLAAIHTTTELVSGLISDLCANLVYFEPLREENPVTLSDGTLIPKGAFTMRQQPRQESRWHFVTTSPEHRVFGHGKRSCPGRFFAGNDIKFFTGEGRKEDRAFGQELNTDPTAKAIIKGRKLVIAI
ncbi:hypothetical protein BDV29DRAFT_190449 [Aspergillus leporis]|uniref:Cytochrome P450 n=1 Tax=Aspergillus leporis TaxID=41062 RepID=A0A5N5X6F3_9EURO|nr:hypothetical protein BDV29DRAFT_190449 [Aspergillus leporis]